MNGASARRGSRGVRSVHGHRCATPTKVARPQRLDAPSAGRGASGPLPSVTGMWDALTQLLTDAAASPWVLAVLLVSCWVDGFFPPFPSESLVIATSALTVSAAGGPPLWAVAAVAAVGAFAGDLTAFWLGRRVPVDRLPLLRSGRGRATVEWSRRSLERRGGVALLAARYVPVGRVAVNLAAGAVGFPARRFAAYAALAAVTWAAYSVVVGVVAGAVLHDDPLLGVVAGVAVGAVLGLVLDAVASRRRTRREASAIPAEGGSRARHAARVAPHARTLGADRSPTDTPTVRAAGGDVR